MALMIVWVTPQASGMPTNPQARTSFSVIELLCASLAIVLFLPLCAGRFARGGDGRLRALGFVVWFHMEACVHGLDHEVTDEADHQQPGHDVHGAVVGLRLRHAMIDLVFA